MPVESTEVGGRYAKYVLFVLVIVYVFNFIDRQILSILAEDIKADLGISDAETLLYGTVSPFSRCSAFRWANWLTSGCGRI